MTERATAPRARVSELAKKSVENFVARIGTQAFTLVGAVVIARTLGPAGKGVYAYAGTLLAMVQMAYAGQAAAISWQYTKRGRSPGALYGAMVRILGMTAVPLALFTIVAGLLLPGQAALLAVGAALPFALFMQISSGFFLADSNVRTVNILQIFPSAVAVCIYVPLLLWAHAGLPTLFIVWGASYAAAAAVAWFALRRYRGQGERAVSASLLREQAKYASQIGLSSFVQYLNFRIDIFLVLFMLGQSALGVYSIGIGFGELLWQLSRPITTASFGRIARGTRAEAAEITATCLRHTFALVAAASIVAFICAPYLVRLVYGAQFAEASDVVRVLMPGIIAYSMMPTLATFFAQQLERPKVPLVFSSISTVLCAGVTAALLPSMGIIGGAIATSASYTLVFVLAAAYFAHQTKIAPRAMFALSRRDLRPYREFAMTVLQMVPLGR